MTRWLKIMSGRQVPLLLFSPIFDGIHRRDPPELGGPRELTHGFYDFTAEGLVDFWLDYEEVWRSSRNLADYADANPDYPARYAALSFRACHSAVVAAQRFAAEFDGQAPASWLLGLQSVGDALSSVGATIIQARFESYRRVREAVLEQNLDSRLVLQSLRPEAISGVSAARREWCGLLRDARSTRGLTGGADWLERIRGYQERWGWVETDIAIREAPTVHELATRLAQESEESTGDENVSQDETPGEAGLKGPPVVQAELLRQETLFRQHRRETYSQVASLVMPCLQTVAQELGTPAAFLRSYTWEELLQAVASGRALSESDAFARSSRMALRYVMGEPVRIVTGTAADAMRDELGARDDEPDIEQSALWGEVAFPGRVIGTARIVRKVEDVARVRPGDVFVASQATPQLVAAVLGCIAAIVTDEGDVTSHASLLAWENRIPCIVGTRFATRVIGDGERIEVIASDGLFAPGSIVRVSRKQE